MSAKHIPNYELIEKIGEGGMGEVYLARDKRLDRKVALKFLSSNMAGDRKARTRLLREVRAASRISHPNVLTIHEIGEDTDGHVFIAMQYVDGESLHTLIAQQRLTVDQTLSIAAQICEGLAQAHDAGIVHRDIKPQNILIDRHGNATILDFGLAKLFDASNLTQSGAMVGTVAYMSPEQVCGSPVDSRSDIFSLGALIYEMLAGQPPFPGDNPAAVINGILNTRPEPPSSRCADCPPAIDRIVLTALAHQPKDRYESAGEMLDDLRAALVPLGASNPGVFRSSPGRKASARPWIKVGVPMSVAFLFALAVFVANPFKFSLLSEQEALADRNAIAVMYFDNIADPTDHDHTAQMITSLMITGLSESPRVSVVSRQRLYDLMNSLGHSGTKVVTPAVATEVGRQAGVRWILTGSVLRTEPQIVLVSNVSNVKDGTVIASQRVDGSDGEDLFAVVDRLCAAVCQDLSLSNKAASSSANESLARVTTSSPDAYKAYLEGLDFKSEIDYELAMRAFERAVHFDSTFAMAYYDLARMQRAFGMTEAANESLARAARHAGKARLIDRLYIESLQAQVSGNLDLAAAKLEELTEKYPQEKMAIFELGTIYYQQFKLDKATGTLERALALDSNFRLVLNNLAYAYHFAGNYEKSIAVADRYIAVAPNEPNPYDTRGEIQAMNGRLDAAIASYTAALERKPDFHHAIANLGHLYLFKGDYDRADSLYRIFFNSSSKELRAAGRMYLAYIPLYQGRIDAALAALDQGLATDETEQVAGLDLADKHELKARIFASEEDYDRALAETAREGEIRCRISDVSCYVARANCIKLLIDSGRLMEAGDSLRSFERQVQQGPASETMLLSYARGLLARAHGDYDFAIEDFRAASRTHDFRARFELAKTCLLDNRLGEAVSLFRGLAGTLCEDRAGHILSALESEYLLGVAYEESGWTIEAEEQFERYVSLKGTNARHSPMVMDALSRLSRLASAD